MAVTFALGATSLTIQNPATANVLRSQKTQVGARDAGGGRYTYDQGVEVKTLDLAWLELRESEKAALLAFFEDTADGMANSFTYTDHAGNGWTAYFDQPELEFVCIGDERASATTFTSGEATYPTTTRQNAVYRVSVRLEATPAA